MPDNPLGNLDDLSQPEREEYPWSPDEDEAFRRGAFKRSWVGTSRKEWNANPIHSDGVMCSSCGYKQHQADIIKDTGGKCFNCWMVETMPDQVRRLWASIDSGSHRKHGETAAPKLVKLDDKKGK